MLMMMPLMTLTMAYKVATSTVKDGALNLCSLLGSLNQPAASVQQVVPRNMGRLPKQHIRSTTWQIGG